MRECSYCGKAILRRKVKGGREREYCNDSCRQLAYRARHPERRYIARALRRVRRERWKEDPSLLPWQEELAVAKREIERLKGENQALELEASLLSFERFQSDLEIAHLRFKLGEAQAERAHLQVLLNIPKKRKEKKGKSEEEGEKG